MPKLKRAVWLAMASMTMFFLALTYAYLQRHGLGPAARWLTPPLLTLLGANTSILIGSSIALARARRFLALRRSAATLRWIAAAFGLGIAFLAGQALAWRWLWGDGIYISVQPNSGFFFLVTAFHAAHLSLALALLAWVLSLAWRGRLSSERPLPIELTAIFWHTLDLTWVYLYLVLLLYR